MLVQLSRERKGFGAVNNRTQHVALQCLCMPASISPLVLARAAAARPVSPAIAMPQICQRELISHKAQSVSKPFRRQQLCRSIQDTALLGHLWAVGATEELRTCSTSTAAVLAASDCSSSSTFFLCNFSEAALAASTRCSSSTTIFSRSSDSVCAVLRAACSLSVAASSCCCKSRTFAWSPFTSPRAAATCAVLSNPSAASASAAASMCSIRCTRSRQCDTASTSCRYLLQFLGRNPAECGGTSSA